MSYERVDTACTRFVVQWVTNATRPGQLHGHMVSAFRSGLGLGVGRARLSVPRSGLLATVTVLPLEDGVHSVAVV